MPVQVELSRIFIQEMADVQFIELSELGGEARHFPIVIGLPEAFAIERRLKGVPIPRPQTHDLLASVVEHLGGRLRHIEITDLRDSTFYACLVVEQNGSEVRIDARPSDAIALGVSENAPIYVSEHVIEMACEDGMAEKFDLPSIEDFDEDDLDDEDSVDEPPNVTSTSALAHSATHAAARCTLRSHSIVSAPPTSACNAARLLASVARRRARVH